MMTVLLHPHIVGRPNRTFWLEEWVRKMVLILISIRFIKYIQGTGDAFIARRIDIAEHWEKTFPYDSETAFGQTPAIPVGDL